MRIEIDQTFKEFLDDPDKLEYIFPSDLNNLQRKYIHHKAQEMNIISKSYGKEPNRQLHIKKRNKQLGYQYFMVQPCGMTEQCLEEFPQSPKHRKTTAYQSNNADKFFSGRLANGPPTVPSFPKYDREVSEIRINLPIFEKRQEILDAINANQIVVISSETGSGKTTQVPQYILEEMASSLLPCKIICTQPRRISTISAAERVSYERGTTLGTSVGYHIRLEQKYGINTNLIYCTTGVFLRNLMCGPHGLKNISHIILDEIHERDKLTDFLLICLKQALPMYPNLKIILMSATVNIDKFLNYFGGGTVLSIPGRQFSIDVISLEQILVFTKYMSPKMREQKAKSTEKKPELIQPNVAIEENLEDPLMDEALDDYLNFSENYDYKIHYEEATAQLGVFFLSEGVSIDYQHSKTGVTALMIAAYLGDKEFITRLCNMGANMDLADKMGKSVFDYAQDSTETMRLLEYIKNSKEHIPEMQNSKYDVKEAMELLQLYDKTTSDDCIDYDLIVKIIQNIHTTNQEGGILVFLPGYDEIMLCNDRLATVPMQEGTYKVYFLHGSMNMKTQQDVFKKTNGQRKIILSTNIAETSITIDDVVFVVDTGKAKEKCYDSYNKVSSLQTHWISQACAKQRMGRAGRTRPGLCFRLYSQQRYESMEEERVPEILRVSLEELCLHTKVLAPEGTSIHSFLTSAPDPPSANSIKVAIENLQFLGALDKEEDLTSLGEYLAQLSIEPHLGKMLLYGVIFRCLDPVLTLAAAMAHKDPFQLPPQANLKTHAAEKRKELIQDITSDHVLYLQVFKKWQESCCNGRVHAFCNQYYISHPTMNSILETRSQLLGQLRSIRFVHQSSSVEQYNRHADCWPLIKAIICTGCYPNLAFPLKNSLATRTEKKVNVQASSACNSKTISTWLVFDEMIKHRNHLLIRGNSAVTTMTVALMCGNDIITPTATTLSIDDWLEFEFPKPVYVTFRQSLEHLINSVLIDPPHNYTSFDNMLVDTLRNILDAEEIEADLKVPESVGRRPKFFCPQTGVVSPSAEHWRERNGRHVRGGRGGRGGRGVYPPPHLQRYPPKQHQQYRG
ncbi:unnamed protein product [Acanthoscelides obtectus]|nr:unnamed protein product [Acanthoscelides obtectus]CAK1660180.1 Probable ATP-dependent RNA helicase YTHDC2 [Acanthoscelides obtectus]